MSAGEGASQKHTEVPEEEPMEKCHRLLKMRDFNQVEDTASINQILGIRRNREFEKARAISDVLTAAEKPLPNGFTNYYGMIRMTKPGPVSLGRFKELMRLLDRRLNSFPLCEEAADKALHAWSVLSNPTTKEEYDLAISTCSNRGTQGNGHAADDVVVVSSDDDDDDDEHVMTMARTARLCKVNGKRVKIIPLKKRSQNYKDNTV